MNKNERGWGGVVYQRGGEDWGEQKGQKKSLRGPLLVSAAGGKEVGADGEIKCIFMQPFAG